MDLREIIKWFIPCFHILLLGSRYKKTRWTFICMFLIFHVRGARATPVVVDAETKNVDSFNDTSISVNQSDSICNDAPPLGPQELSEGRTFGRPFKKLVAGLLPIIFQLGAASAWAVLAALAGLKTLALAALILKLLLLAGALKLGALFGQKQHGHGWEGGPPHGGWEGPPHGGWGPAPSKEIHLHIHNGQPVPEHAAYSGWSRAGAPAVAAGAPAVAASGSAALDPHINVLYEPYADGPPTISTPYGNYVKVLNTLPNAPSSVGSYSLPS